MNKNSNVAQLVECLPPGHKDEYDPQHHIKPKVVGHASNPSIEDAEEAQKFSRPQPQKEFKGQPGLHETVSEKEKEIKVFSLVSLQFNIGTRNGGKLVTS